MGNGGARMAACGGWASPIGASTLAAAGVRFGGIALDGGDALWVEGRPADAGRNVLVRARVGHGPEDLTPPPWNVRSRVHEYGGGAFAIRGGVAWFVHDADQRLHVLPPGAPPRALTPQGPFRFADPSPSPDATRVACVREAHGDGEPENTLVSVDAAGGGVTELARGHDFYAYPRWSHDGRQIAFIAWDHPNMPWDGTTLYLARVGRGGVLDTPRAVAGGPAESIFQPQWGPDGRLWFVSDAGGFWNLHVLGEDGPRRVIDERAEYGLPLWQFAMSTYGFADARTLVAASCADGAWRVEAVDLDTLARTPMPEPVSGVSSLVAADGHALIVAAAPDRAAALLRWDLRTDRVHRLRESTTLAIPPGCIVVESTTGNSPPPPSM